MSNFEKPLPEWNAKGIEPPQSKRNEGWKEGDKPPAPWHNWWMHTTYMALDEIRKFLDELEVVTKWEDIEGKPTSFPPSSHKHSISDVTDLQTELNKKETPEGAQEKADKAETNANEYTNTKFGQVEYPVTSVNDKTGAVTITKADVGLGNVGNVKQASKEEHDNLQKQVTSHKADYTSHIEDDSAHGIGDKSTLKTTEKSTIVGALNELFTNVSDGKKLIGGAITDVDEGVEVPADATFEELSRAIGKVETGKKWASGEESSRFSEITGLDFKPNHFFAFSMDARTGSILVGSEEAKLSNEKNNTMLAQSSANYIKTFNLTFIQGGIEGFTSMHNLSYPVKWYAIE